MEELENVQEISKKIKIIYHEKLFGKKEREPNPRPKAINRKKVKEIRRLCKHTIQKFLYEHKSKSRCAVFL